MATSPTRERQTLVAASHAIFVQCLAIQRILYLDQSPGQSRHRYD